MIAAGLLLAGYLAGLAAAGHLLIVSTPIRSADMLVVLGGDDPPRSDEAIRLYFRGVAPLVLVSGRGDCTAIRHDMVAAGVPAKAIETECGSTTTRENAEYSAAILRRFAVRRAVLVTSWYHSRRALAAFEAVAPDIQWMSAPTPVGWWPALVGSSQATAIVEEYPKIAWYALRYGISPLGVGRRSPSPATKIEGSPWISS